MKVKLGDLSVVVTNGRTQETKSVKAGIPSVTVMNKEEYEEHWKVDRGVAAVPQAEQLIRWIKNGWIDIKDSRTVAVMGELHKVLDELLFAAGE
jgi:hypothetical protein